MAAFAGNLAFARGRRELLNPLVHTWALGVELQLALLFPLRVMLFAAWGERVAGTETGAERRWIVMRTVLIGMAGAGLVRALGEHEPQQLGCGPTSASHASHWLGGLARAGQSHATCMTGFLGSSSD